MVVRNMEWVLAELARLHHNVSATEAHAQRPRRQESHSPQRRAVRIDAPRRTGSRGAKAARPPVGDAESLRAGILRQLLVPTRQIVLCAVSLVAPCGR